MGGDNVFALCLFVLWMVLMVSIVLTCAVVVVLLAERAEMRHGVKADTKINLKELLLFRDLAPEKWKIIYEDRHTYHGNFTFEEGVDPKPTGLVMYTRSDSRFCDFLRSDGSFDIDDKMQRDDVTIFELSIIDTLRLERMLRRSRRNRILSETYSEILKDIERYRLKISEEIERFDA